MIMIWTNDGRVIRISIVELVLERIQEAVSDVHANFWHLRVRLVNQIHLNRRKDNNLIPWNEDRSCQGTEWGPLEL